MEKPTDFLIRESGTHYHIRLPVEGHDLVVMVDKQNFTLTIPYFEYMFIPSIVKLIVQLYKKEGNKNPVVNEFLKFLQKPENKEELKKLQSVFRRS
jgi:hypothetical protein